MADRPTRTLLKHEPSERSKKKKRFFKGDKPFIRKFEHTDMWILWAAYKEGSFPEMGEMEREQFYELIRNRLSTYQCLYLVDDNNRKFKDKRGPVCIIGANSDGWKYIPHVEYFKWATKYNIIRVTICFLNWISFQKDVGVCIIESLENTMNLFRYMKNFIGINYVGKMPRGDIRGTTYLFSLAGGKKDNGSGQAGKGFDGDGNGSGSTRSSSARNSDVGESKVPSIGSGSSG